MNYFSGKSLLYKISILLLLAILVIAVLWTTCWGRGPLDGVIVDRVTSKPISGALIIVSWPTIQGNLLASIPSGHVHFRESFTNEQGAFHAVGWWPIFFCSEQAVLRDRPQIIVIKEGYQILVVRHTLEDQINEVCGDTPTQQTTQRLRIGLKLTRPIDNSIQISDSNALVSAFGEMGMYRDKLHDCWWKSVPNLVKYLAKHGSLISEEEMRRCKG
jgi:hypothetical protein